MTYDELKDNAHSPIEQTSFADVWGNLYNTEDKAIMFNCVYKAFQEHQGNALSEADFFALINKMILEFVA